MDPITIALTALRFARPFLKKCGEKIAEKIGEDIWLLVKKLFPSKDQSIMVNEVISKQDGGFVATDLAAAINQDPSLREILEKKINLAEADYKKAGLQVNNFGNIEKQINIETNFGDITM